jgi:hypothetical protein
MCNVKRDYYPVGGSFTPPLTLVEVGLYPDPHRGNSHSCLAGKRNTTNLQERETLHICKKEKYCKFVRKRNTANLQERGTLLFEMQ